jgi:hypothetical protein
MIASVSYSLPGQRDGAVTLAMGGSKDPATPNERVSNQPHISIVPTWLGDGARRAMVPGLAAVGTF